MNREQLLIQAAIRRLISPTDVISVYAGPDQFPRTQEIRGPVRMHRWLVWRDALGSERYDEEAGLKSLNLPIEDEATVRKQCAFIREHTKPMQPIWKVPENPFLNNDWDFRTGPVRRTSARATYYDRNWNNIQPQQVIDDDSDCTLRTAVKARPEWWGYATTNPTRPHLTSQ